jgi:3-hydroxyisobutyrate dehydrogenase
VSIGGFLQKLQESMARGGLGGKATGTDASPMPCFNPTVQQESRMTRITFLGLGAMGQRMAARLLDAGHTVTVWNRSPQAAVALRERGATVASTPREATEGAEAVVSMVFDDAASRSVWLDPATGALHGMARSAIAIESSTLSPGWMGELHAALAERGIALIDAPVAGSRPQAEAGQLIFMAGGSDAAIERIRPLLLAMGGAVQHVGPASSGAWLKLAVNALFGTQVAAMAELLTLLRGAGLDTERTLAALKAMPVTSPAAAGAAALMQARQFAPQAPVSLIAKDLGYALASAKQALPLTQAVTARFTAAQDAGFGSENLVAVAKLYH